MDNKLNEIKEEVDFQEVVVNPVRLFGATYLLTIIAIIMAGAFYLKNMDNISDNNPMHKNAEKRDTTAELTTKPAVVLAGVDIKLFTAPTDELLAKGGEVFSKNCVSCHGDKGLGDGVAGAGLNPKPRNFSSADAWKNGRKISEIYKTLEEGIAGGGMSSYNYLPVDERLALAHYVRNFKKDDAPKITEEELSELDLTYNLALGRASKAQIPVKKAKELQIIDNWNNKAVRVNTYSEKLKSSDNSLAKRVIANDNKAFTYLMDNGIWKQSSTDFINHVASALPQNGFSAEVLRLNKADLSSLHSYLVSMYSAQN